MAWLLTASGIGSLPPGALLLVCDFGHAAFEASLLVRTATEFGIQATARAPDSGGRAIEAVLAEHCLTAVAATDADLAERLRTGHEPADQRGRAVLDTTIHLAARRLATGQTATVLLPQPCPALRITASLYTALVAPIVARCADTAAGVVQAAGLDPGRLAGVYAVGGSASDTALDALTEQGLEPTPVGEPEFAAVVGAVATPAPDQPAPAAPNVARRLDWRGVRGTAVAGACSLALISGAIYASVPPNFVITTYGNVPEVNWGAYAMAATCAMLAATTAAESFTRPQGDRPGAHSPARAWRRHRTRGHPGLRSRRNP